MEQSTYSNHWRCAATAEVHVAPPLLVLPSTSFCQLHVRHLVHNFVQAVLPSCPPICRLCHHHRRGHIAPPPFALWFWFGLEFQILLEIICQGIFYHIQMIHEVWMTRTPFIISHCLERPMTQFVRVPPYEIWVFLTSLIFFCKKR